MELFANDLSVHEQFLTVAAFREGFARMQCMRAVAKHHGREVQCHAPILETKPVPGVTLREAVAQFPRESERRAALSWLTRLGPFWEDMRQHAGGDWLESEGSIVTDNAVGEAAFRAIQGVPCGLLSFAPSNWNSSPVEVVLRRESEGLADQRTDIENWWSADALGEALQDRAPPIRSWDGLREASGGRFPHLVFADDCFEPLAGVPFASGAAARILVLLETLERLSQAFDSSGSRTREGHRIYQDHFNGDRAWFSDSSDSEKRKFGRELTFTLPGAPARHELCSWHGKVSHATVRLHFSWPITAGNPVFIVYAGPKITKR